MLFLMFSFSYKEANAAIFGLGSVAGSAISDIFQKVMLTIKDILVAGIMKLAATLTAASLTLTQKITTQIFDQNSFVYKGWTTFRDLANLGFVLGIIIIAIATILRIKSYQAQSILWKLVVAALIVNFSLMIGGAIIKVSDVFSNSFLQDITLNQNIANRNDPAQVSDKVSMMILENSKVSSVLTSNSTVMNVASKDLQGDIQNIGDVINLFIQILVAVFVSFVLLVMAIMFLLRYFYISFLLILAPGAWLLWIFPSAYRFWRDWWTHFLKWVFFAPLMLLFVKLSMIMMSNSSSLGFTGLSGSPDQTGGVHGFDAIMLTLMSGAILIGGLKISQSLGMAGSSFILKQANKATSKAQGWAKNKTTRGAARVGRPMITPVKKGAQWAANTRVGRFLGAGAVARGLTRGETSVRKKETEYREERRRMYAALNPEDVKKLASSVSGQDKEGLMQSLAEKGRIDPSVIKSLGYGNDKDGRESLVSFGEKLEREGNKKAADQVYVAASDNRSTLEARKKYDSIYTSDGIKKRTELELRALKGEISDDDYKKELEPFSSAEKGLSDARTAFDNKYNSSDNQRIISQNMFGVDEKSLSESEKHDRLAHANYINNETSGNGFYGALRGVKPDQQTYLMKTLIKAVTKEAELTGSLKKAYDSGVDKLNSTELKGFQDQLREFGLVGQRLGNRVEKSVLGDMAAGNAYRESSSSSAPSAPPAGGSKK